MSRDIFKDLVNFSILLVIIEQISCRLVLIPVEMRATPTLFAMWKVIINGCVNTSERYFNNKSYEMCSFILKVLLVRVLSY